MIVSSSLSEKLVEMIDAKAKRERKSRSTFIKDCLIRNIKGDDDLLIITSVKNLHDKIATMEQDQKHRLDMFFNLFVFFLARWFAAHPALSDKSEGKLGLARKELFLKEFLNSFSLSGSAYESLLADIAEIIE